MDEEGRLHEQTFNIALARALRRCRSEWRNEENSVRVERSQVLVGGKAQRPDILVSQRDGYPIAIECEYGQPAIGDATSRLGKRLAANMLPIRSAIAVGIPPEVEWWSDFELDDKLSDASGIEFRFVILSADINPDSRGDVDPSDVYQWPDRAYVTGDVRFLADLCDGAAAPPNVVETHAASVAEDLSAWARGMSQSVDTAVAREIAQTLGQDSIEQGLRLACCIWLTTLRLHDLIADIPSMRLHGILKIAQLRRNRGEPFTLSDLRDAWLAILEVNYKSIFVPALNALNEGLPTLNGAEVLDGLSRMAERVTALRLGSSIDFAGELFPKLLDDREETASHYTLPTTAQLLAGIAVDRVRVSDWSSTDEVSELRIADFACGTGTLLRAAYSHIRNRYEVAGGDDLARIHKAMLQGGITGTDINALAAHMTAAALSSLDMSQIYRETNIGAIPIHGGTTGALEFLNSESRADILGQSVVRTDSASTGGTVIGAPDRSYDLVIQNPPYTSPVAGEHGRKIFDVAGITEEDRQRSVARLNSQRRAIERKGINISNGRAGMGTDFTALADIKLNDGGVFASVLPLSAAHTSSWTKFRSHLEKNYTEITAIAFTTDSRSMMSADTHMNEMLVIASKSNTSHVQPNDSKSVISDQRSRSVLCFNLRRDLTSVNDSDAMVKEIGSICDSESVSGVIRFAQSQIGDWARLPVHGEGFPWAVLGMRDRYLSGIMCQLFDGKLQYPPLDLGIEIGLPMVKLGDIVGIGPTHGQIGHVRTSSTGRGAFVFDEISPGDVPQYPGLWDAIATNKMSMLVDPTHEGTPLEGREDRMAKVLSERSDSFISQDARFTSQALTAARTRVKCLGSSTWVAMMHDDRRVLDALVLWMNSTLGMLLRTGYGNTSHSGRARIAIGSTKRFPVPNFAEESDAGENARSVATNNFDELANLTLRPAAYAWTDENRHQIDTVVLQMLGIESEMTIDAVSQIRSLLCREPSVHGGNKRILRDLGIEA